MFKNVRQKENYWSDYFTRPYLSRRYYEFFDKMREKDGWRLKFEIVVQYES